MTFNIGRLVGGYEGTAMEAAKSAMPYKPRSLREQIQDQIAAHRSKISDLDAALEALTPDVEKALDALQKIG